MEEWKSYKLGDIASIQTGPFGSQLHNEDYVNNGTPIVTVEHLGAREFTTQNLPMVSNEDKERLIKYSLREGDIVFSRVGSVDRCSYVGKAQDGWLFSGRCLRVRAGGTVNPLFLYYYFQKESVKQEIRSVAVGATMPSINTKLLSDLNVEMPSVKAQKRIAEVLSSIDDIIELNNRINHNLEEQAQALYKSWFVNFEPFKGGQFVDSELGLIPEGWRIGTLSEIADVTMGQSPSGASFNEEGRGIIFYQGRTEFGFRFPSIKLFTTEPTRFSEPKSILMSVRAPVGDINISKVRCCIGRGLASINPHTSSYSFVLYTMKSKAEELDMYNGEGTVFGSINRKELEGLTVLIPPKDVINSFNTLVTPVDMKVEVLSDEITNLQKQRDTLLPQLMSGQFTC